jgi:hypothetical protein
MSDRTYDQFGHRFMIPIVQQTGISITGTASALAAIAGTIVQLPFAAKLVSGSRVNVTGKTDAVAAMSAVVCRSVAGTGTVFAAATYAFSGTNATGAVGTAATVATGTAAEFAANDTVSISLAIGTIAGLTTHSFCLGFEELYN